jgi:hypothetical protein
MLTFGKVVEGTDLSHHTKPALLILVELAVTGTNLFVGVPLKASLQQHCDRTSSQTSPESVLWNLCKRLCEYLCREKRT